VRLCVALAIAAACERTPTSAPPCLADEIGALSPGWTLHPECTPDSVRCRQACTTGDAHSCVALALEIDRTKDAHEAQDLYERACRLGLATGCTNWGAHVWTHCKNVSSTCLARVFDKTCKSGDPWGCGMVARLLVENSKSPLDHARGIIMLEQACDEAPITCRMLARYVEKGNFGSPDPAWVEDLMIQGCDGGDVTACGHKSVEELDNESR